MTQKINMEEKVAELGKEIPGIMGALGGLHEEVLRDGALSAKTKELMMLAIAVSIRCEYCLWKHVPAAIKMGASREEILEAVGTAIQMSGGPGAAYGSAVVLKILNEYEA